VHAPMPRVESCVTPLLSSICDTHHAAIAIHDGQTRDTLADQQLQGWEVREWYEREDESDGPCPPSQTRTAVLSLSHLPSSTVAFGPTVYTPLVITSSTVREAAAEEVASPRAAGDAARATASGRAAAGAKTEGGVRARRERGWGRWGGAAEARQQWPADRVAEEVVAGSCIVIVLWWGRK